MKNDKKKFEEPEDYLFNDEFNAVVSATECTGLMSIPPQNEEEADSYADIYVVPKEVNKTPPRKTKEEAVAKCVHHTRQIRCLNKAI